MNNYISRKRKRVHELLEGIMVPPFEGVSDATEGDTVPRQTKNLKPTLADVRHVRV